MLSKRLRSSSKVEAQDPTLKGCSDQQRLQICQARRRALSKLFHDAYVFL